MYPTQPQPSPSVLPSMAAYDNSKDPEPIVETYISTRSAEVEAKAMNEAKRDLKNRLLHAHRLLAQPGYTWHSGPEASPSDGVMVSESSGAGPPPRPVDAFLRQNVRELHQASSIPIRTEKDLRRRSEPYQSPDARPTKRRKVEASQSTPPVIQIQPTWGVIPDSTVNPKKTQGVAEGDKPVSGFSRSRVPHVTRWSI